MGAPERDIDWAKAAHRRLLDTVSGVSDDRAREPSLLPGWTIGHVLTHLARNADGHAGQFQAAARGEAAQQYPGGPNQRARDIEAGAGRSANELYADLQTAVGRLEDNWVALSDDAWREGQALQGEVVRSMPELVYRRWREVEVHHVDLGLSYHQAGWPSAFVDREMEALMAGLQRRLPPGTSLNLEAVDTGEHWAVPPGGAASPVVATHKWRLVAWLLGRLDDQDLPALGPWERP